MNTKPKTYMINRFQNTRLTRDYVLATKVNSNEWEAIK